MIKDSQNSKIETAPVLACHCLHPSQDLMYGLHQRVHTVHGIVKKSLLFECTVCGTKRNK